jgi:hypothetical protein
MTDTTTDHAKAAADAKKANDERIANAKKTLGEQREARDKAGKEHAKMASEMKPTPTQEENDLAAMGVPVTEHEADGSPPDNTGPYLDPRGPHEPHRLGQHEPQHKQSEAGKPAGGDYSTRAAQPKP